MPSLRYIISGTVSAIAAIVYWFWAFPYRSVLSYREQLQLFQTTETYFTNLASRPGGIATYAGEFLTQFFNNFWIGAAVMTILFLLFLLSCYLICNKFSPANNKANNLLLSIIPLLALWLFLGNPNATVGFIVALLISTAGAYAFIATASDYYGIESYLRTIVATSLLYWVVGPVAIIFVMLAIAYICADKKVSVIVKVVYAILSLVCLGVNVYVWSLFLPYPLSYQLIGIGYVMTPDVIYAGQVIVEVLCVVIPVVALLICGVPEKFTVPALVVAEIICAVIIYPRSYDEATYRLIDYDYMVRANDWEGILRYSDEHNPDLPLSVSATNLASGMTGQLDSRAFDYYQNGTEGLLPPFVKETLSSWTTGEIFFQLGMVNSAQRFYFEGMEAIPNYNKSSRAVKRMAETAMIRGDYALAEKYLRILENTTFYRKWAQRNLDLIKTSGAIDNHPLYGRLRKRMIDEDYLFSEGELDKTLGQLFIKDAGNELARQYLILYPLLQRDLNKFVQYMGVVAESLPQYNPLLAQQTLAFISMKNGQSIPQNMVPPTVEQSLREFAKAWTSKDPAKIEPFRRSLYHYLLSDK